MSDLALNRVNRATLREQALDNLREGILNGSMPPGTRLSEVELSDQLGVSRGTVREALRTLVEAGLVEVGARGMQVRQMTASQVAELYQVRLALEKEAVAVLLERPDAGRRIDELEQALPSDEDLAAAPLSERLEADLDFHELLCLLSGNTILVTVWRRLKNLTRVVVLNDSAGRNEDMMKRTYHEPIITALRSGDPAAAQAAMADHMAAASARWAEVAKQA